MSRFGRLKRQGLAWLGRPQWRVIGGVRLELPAEHLLPEYQAAHRLYDRFLPHLAARLAPGDAVVDVGANVGDTLAALLAGQGGLQLLALEPDAGFFAVLERNAWRLRAAYPTASIELRAVLVGDGDRPRALVGGGGTRRAVPAPAGVAGQCPRRLDQLLAEAPSGFRQRLRLLKSDVDGADHEVIASALGSLLQLRPMLFFECQVVDQAARTGYLDCLRPLLDGGYSELFLFDNFGRPLPTADKRAPLDELRHHIDQLLAPPPEAPRIHYLDVLLTTRADRPLAERAVAAHLGNVT